MIFAIDCFNLKDNKRILKILEILKTRYPTSPKYNAALAQAYV